MLLRLHLTDLTVFKNFRYYAMRDIGDDCLEPVKETPKEPTLFKQFTVFGVRDFTPNGKNYHEIEEPVADFDAAIEAAAYTMALEAALEGRLLQ